MWRGWGEGTISDNPEPCTDVPLLGALSWHVSSVIVCEYKVLFLMLVIISRKRMETFTVRRTIEEETGHAVSKPFPQARGCPSMPSEPYHRLSSGPGPTAWGSLAFPRSKKGGIYHTHNLSVFHFLLELHFSLCDRSSGTIILNNFSHLFIQGLPGQGSLMRRAGSPRIHASPTRGHAVVVAGCLTD